MTILRWSLGGLLTSVSLLAALKSFMTYAGRGAWLGVAVVAILGAAAIFGFVTLLLARVRLGKELGKLSSQPPQGELWAARRRELLEIRDRGAVPDLDALASATAAREGGRAYLGRYLVAVTVLIGLVGTLAGLIETFRGMAPLLMDESVSALKVMAGPLTGLDVTLGASVVGILVTLALSLVQGDLVLAEEIVLSRLHERTRHVLMPELFPPSESAGERTAREISAMRAELGRFLERAAETTARRVEKVTATALEKLSLSVETSLSQAVMATVQGLREIGAEHARAQEKLARELGDLGRDMGKLVSSASERLAAHQESSLAAIDARWSGLAASCDKMIARFESGLGALGEAHANVLLSSTQSIVQAIAKQVGDHGSRLVEVAAELSGAAADLLTGAMSLAPSARALAPELGSLARELSLLGARLDSEDSHVAVLDELVRLGESIEQLQALHRLSEPSQGAA
ncbi:MAG: hypothetical protein HY698_19170 [Deltaproteobacteria bacterium]|nr:hypothetical protein [Deltaproteobacteria bacterium]